MGDNHQQQPAPGTTPQSPTPTNPPAGNQPDPSTPEGQAAIKAAEEKAAADKAAAEKAAADKAGEFKPLKLEDIKVPDGLELDKDLASGFIEVVNKYKLAPEVQQALIELQSKSQQALSGKDSENWNATQSQWEKDARADPVFGGAKFDATMADVGKFMEAYGDDEARAAFDLTGAGNHPAIIRMLAKAAAVIKEAGPVPSGQPGNPPKEPAEILYPNQGKT